jgi:flagellar biosynthesis GTPase FlhF
MDGVATQLAALDASEERWTRILEKPDITPVLMNVALSKLNMINFQRSNIIFMETCKKYDVPSLVSFGAALQGYVSLSDGSSEETKSQLLADLEFQKKKVEAEVASLSRQRAQQEEAKTKQEEAKAEREEARAKREEVKIKREEAKAEREAEKERQERAKVEERIKLYAARTASYEAKRRKYEYQTRSFFSRLFFGW